jgi:DNA-directed RNA polymerase subunit omega
MGHVAVEELLKRCGSIYKLVILAAKRAKELAEGAPPLVDNASRKVTTTALEEILQGKVVYQPPEREAGSEKRGRGAKGKAEKRKAVET